MENTKISDLTVGELQQLIRETVQQAVAEVIIEFNAAAEIEAQLDYEAEMTEYLRAIMQGTPQPNLGAPHLDD